MNYLTKPKLQNANVQQINYQGEPAFLIQDIRKPARAIAVPYMLGPLVDLCDGQHTISEIRASLEVRYGLRLTQMMIEQILRQFDQVMLLEGALEAYRAAPFRPPALAGASYPADPGALRQMLQGYLDGIDNVPASPAESRGIISPHIDYYRGGPVYARVWASAAEAIRQAELIILLATDHNGNLGTLTLTPQNYATPLGMMPTDKDLVDRLAAVLGPEHAFADELHHRSEWSIELPLIWLQYLRGEEPCPMLPVLCGSFLHFMLGQADIEAESRFQAFTDLLREEMNRRRTVIVASGDLAHLGPQFDTPPLDKAAQTQMEAEDEELVKTLCQGQAGTFFKFMQAGQYWRNVCGLSPFYFTLDILGQTRGQAIAYQRCPADHNGITFIPNSTSFVSVCGLVFE